MTGERGTKTKPNQEMTPEQYEEKRAARIERLNARAERVEKRSEELLGQARTMASCIPMGQPIHVGHYSEGRDRRFRARIDDKMRAGIAAMDEAAALARRAEAAADNSAVYSDDPTAVDQLEARVAELEAQQTRWKSINARVRKLKVTRKTPELAKRLLEVLDEDECRELMAGFAHYGDQVAIASFQMSNNNANLNRLKQRLERVKRNQSAADVEREGNGIRCVDSPSDNRVRLFFPGKPDSVVRDGLKKAGFRWSPSNECWQAFRTWRAVEHAKSLLA